MIMHEEKLSFFIKGLKIISDEVGILRHVIRTPRMSNDPKLVNYGVWQCNTEQLGGMYSEGRSGSCGFDTFSAMLGTLGETLERYAPAFYDPNNGIKSSFKDLKVNTIGLEEYSLFHEEQYKFFEEKNWTIKRFTKDIELTWVNSIDLTSGKETWIPAQFIYMPFKGDEFFITASNSTGLASHSNYHKAILTALYECVERDSFMLTWMHQIAMRKIIISNDIKSYLDRTFPKHYKWHFFDTTYDLGIPSVFGILEAEEEFGQFIVVGSASRGTIGEAVRKVIQEIGQGIPYMRWFLGEYKNWTPPKDYNELLTFADHSLFYNKQKDHWHVFDKWIKMSENHPINFNESCNINDAEEIKSILQIMKSKGYNVLLKDISTVDIRQLGSYSIKVIIPQLIQMAGAYPFYFNGSKRLYKVPELLGLGAKDYSDLNKYPHPFP
jgi:ribosomal protein S12 methylthiotransferase accessory factor